MRTESENVESAVSFAASMIRQGKYVGQAIKIASRYYKVEYEAVQRGLSARAGSASKGKKHTQKPAVKCQNCGEKPAVWKCRCRIGYEGIGNYYTCEDCGKKMPCWVEVPFGKEVWTAYKPTKKKEAELQVA